MKFYNLLRLDGEITRASDYHKLIWKDMIHAVLHEVPKLKIHVKVIHFYSKSIFLWISSDTKLGSIGVGNSYFCNSSITDKFMIVTV
jgi:hypothetical protein